MATIVSADVVKVWHVLIIAFLIGSAHAFEIPARQSFFIEMVGRENLLNAIALNSAAFHGARMAGPAIAGLIMGTWSIAACFYINTLSFIAAIVALIKMRFRPEDEKKRPQKKGLYKEFAEGMKYIFSNQKVFTLIISVGIISFFGFPYITFLPVYAKEILKTGATGLGILMGCAGAGAFTGAIILAFRGDFSKKGLLLIVSGIVFSLALLVFSISATIWLSYVMLFLIGLGAINQIATANTLLQLNVPDELRGRIMSSFTTVFLGMSTIGNFIVGSYAALVGTKTALLTSSIFCLLGTLLLVMKKPEILEIGSD
jgi:MFS family permease